MSFTPTWPAYLPAQIAKFHRFLDSPGARLYSNPHHLLAAERSSMAKQLLPCKGVTALPNAVPITTGVLAARSSGPGHRRNSSVGNGSTLNTSAKTAVVTGGAPGLGLATTAVLAAAGARVVVIDLPKADQGRLNDIEGDVVFAPADVTSEDDVQRA